MVITELAIVYIGFIVAGVLVTVAGIRLLKQKTARPSSSQGFGSPLPPPPNNEPAEGTKDPLPASIQMFEKQADWLKHNEGSK